MRPILLKSHTRPITQVTYNREGDLLFTAGKDNLANVFYSDNGERLGSYGGTDTEKGHNGAVYSLDVDYHSRILATGGADNETKLWDVETGRNIHSFQHPAVVRSVAIAEGSEKLMCIEARQGGKAVIKIFNMKRMMQDGKQEELLSVNVDCQGKINRGGWGPLNKNLYTAGDDGFVRSFDAETGEPDKYLEAHDGVVNDLRFSADRMTFITASTDMSARLFDTMTLEPIKTYKSDRPINSATISPLMDHVALGGGQDAASVTTTAGRTGRFETLIHHKIFEHSIGSIKGHFGPINSIMINPDGRSFSTGGEDGYVRINHFDPDYFEFTKDA
mmetsp:Transcript_25131/g.57853  ORF Transcript_25131/g.57853 Transcript_25131/m.57853 type:complete len:332 (+) Transcript_25131:16-1011(+)|eukprot:CAMPEP_0114552540 /NCGR_PEP_ID=MMETSP0114-20121206/7177_1 /TAXON_ID=31324 /ORGANISM="Goniomonas sp, Strain m" /LENGTH=331 /DNA_ID=CAMNT_0001737419 /DNA_START=12 /DNA_END=1007 /DNA_ORIENTATION=-